MTPFGGYAAFYDALYATKHYESECDFVEQVWARYATAPVRRVLDLGCGTGGHLLPLARRGYQVEGVDRAVGMLEQASRKAEAAGHAFPLHLGDLRTLELGVVFDAVIAMFAVLSYQCEQGELLAALHSAHRHLAPGGLFLFDVWFGPALLGDLPVDRYRIVEREGERIVRFAHPELDLLRQVVTVHYRIWRLRGPHLVEEVEEQHPMRFFFPQELRHLLDHAGFDLLRLCRFGVLDEEASTRSWTVSAIARRRDAD